MYYIPYEPFVIVVDCMFSTVFKFRTGRFVPYLGYPKYCTLTILYYVMVEMYYLRLIFKKVLKTVLK